jgi:hypothetical protein
MALRDAEIAHQSIGLGVLLIRSRVVTGELVSLEGLVAHSHPEAPAAFDRSKAYTNTWMLLVASLAHLMRQCWSLPSTVM